MAILRGFAIAFFLLAMILFPQTVFAAAGKGLSIWWQAVVPSLFPFFITAELLLRTGMAKALGVWLEPLMRPLFRLPGAAALAVVMGFVSGSPTGATITAQLRKQGLCSKEEGERLLAFTNNAGPLYILAATAIGILGHPALGIWIWFSHYPINFLFGLILRFFGKKKPAGTNLPAGQHLFQQGLRLLKEEACPPLGQLLGQSIKSALGTILTIGGFMVFFAVFTGLLQQVGVLNLLTKGTAIFCQALGLSTDLAPAFANGLFEMTIGVAALQDCSAPILQQMTVAGMIIAWNGLCVQAQVISVLDGTDLSPRLYIISRVCHFFLAAIFLIWAAPTIPTSNFPLPTPSLPSIGTLWIGAMATLVVLTALSLWHQRHQAC